MKPVKINFRKTISMALLLSLTGLAYGILIGSLLVTAFSAFNTFFSIVLFILLRK